MSTKAVEELRPLHVVERIQQVQDSIIRLSEILKNAGELAIRAGSNDEHRIVWAAIGLHLAEFQAHLSFIEAFTQNSLDDLLKPLREKHLVLEKHCTDRNQQALRDSLAELQNSMHPMVSFVERMSGLVKPPTALGAVGFNY